MGVGKAQSPANTTRLLYLGSIAGIGEFKRLGDEQL